MTKSRIEYSDPMEKMIEDALIDVGEKFTKGGHGDHSSLGDRLDFHLVDKDIYIEVKQFHTERIAAQMAYAPNIIAAQGAQGVAFLADLIRKGLG